MVFGRVRRGEHLAALSARRRPQVLAAGPRVGAVHVAAMLGQVPDQLPVALGARLHQLRRSRTAVLLFNVNLEVVLAREQLLALFALEESSSRGFVFFLSRQLRIRFMTPLFVRPKSS